MVQNAKLKAQGYETLQSMRTLRLIPHPWTEPDIL